jgi:hypothetical protein
MRTTHRYLSIMFLLFSCVMLFSATAQAQFCFEYSTDANCKCPDGYVKDGGNGCKPIAMLPVCGNGTLEQGEQCETYSRNCLNCICVDGTVPDPVNLGSCIVPNKPPVIDPIGDKQRYEVQLLQFTITASDPDSNALTYTASNLPPGASFINQVFSWTPDHTQAGNYTGVRFEVSDGSSIDYEVITITVWENFDASVIH